MSEKLPLDSTFIPSHLHKLKLGGDRRPKRIQIYRKCLANSRLSTDHLESIKTFSCRKSLDCDASDNKEPASSMVYKSLLSARQYDEFGRPIKGQKLNESSRQVIVRKSTLLKQFDSLKS
jgi:hypothetical protein